MKSRMKSRGIAAVVIMATLTGCWSGRSAGPCSPAGYLILRKGQVYTSPRDMTLVDLSVVERKDALIADLLEALRKDEARALVE